MARQIYGRCIGDSNRFILCQRVNLYIQRQRNIHLQWIQWNLNRVDNYLLAIGEEYTGKELRPKRAATKETTEQ